MIFKLFESLFSQRFAWGLFVDRVKLEKHKISEKEQIFKKTCFKVLKNIHKLKKVLYFKIILCKKQKKNQFIKFNL